LTLSVHNVTDWSADQFDWPNVMSALATYCEPFPEDVTVESVLMDVVHGKQTLWIVRDGGVTVSVVLVQIGRIDATGWVRATITGYGGTKGIEALPLLAQIEDWARDQGANEIEVVGRVGWRRALAPQGYAEKVTILRKRL
jgi:hypothetical protein